MALSNTPFGIGGGGTVNINIGDAFAEAAARGIYHNTNRFFIGMQAAFKNLMGNKTAFVPVNRRLAGEMQIAVLDSYDQRVEGRKTSGPYRIRGTVPGQGRFAGGALRGALASSEMLLYDSVTVGFGDADVLDQEAAHWFRLNYGAGNRAKELYSGRPYAVRFGRKLGTIRMDEVGPSVNQVYMPRGYWRTGGNSPGFYPTGSHAEFPTQGIAGRRYMDAGAQAFARRFPDAYLDLLRKFVHQAAEENKGPLAGIDVSPLSDLL